MDIDDLKYYISGARKLARGIDVDNFNYPYEISPMIFNWKSEGFKIESVLINDILVWLYY